ncbi:MAG: serine/threonine-protein kinase [Byssovorax sp.]
MNPQVPPAHHARSDEEEQTVTNVMSPSAAAQRQRQPARAKRCASCQQVFSGEARFCPFDGDALNEIADWNPSDDPMIGQIIDGRYEVTAVLGEGGMGTVYEVKHVALGRRFALKVLRRDIADTEHVARFVQEAKAAAAIGHPNIVAVSDFGEIRLPPRRDGARDSMTSSSAPVPYFVMEFLTGISLAALLRAEKTLAPFRVANILHQCASGLAAAHAAGVIHRDLKPDNIFLTRNNEREFVKLLDFGVAKMAGAGRLTRAGMVFGTPHYMSPEQAAGHSVDHRADIYALGVILYECFTGHVPFEADTYMGVLTKHMFATPEPLDRLVPDASRLGALAPIAMRCLAKSPGERYASMAEVAAALEAAMADPVLAAPTSLRPPPGKRDGESSLRPPGLRPIVSPGVLIGAGSAVLVLIALVAWLALRSPAAASTPVKANESAAPPTATATIAAQPVPELPATATATAVVAPPPVPTPVAPEVKKPEVPAKVPVSKPTSPTKTPSTPPRKGGGGDVVDPWSH